MADRYCSNCGHELSDDARFCPSCGRPVHETAHVPTPEADVPVPPPPGSQQQAEGTTAPPPPQQAEALPPRRSTANKLQVFGCAGLSLIGVLVVAVVVVALVAGSGGGEGEPVAGSGGGGSDVLDKPPTIVCEVGTPCDLGESTVTVTKADKTDLIATSLGNFEGDFVLIEFDYTYGGSAPAGIEDYNWQLEDGESRTYNYTFDPTSAYERDNDRALIDRDRALIYEEIDPGTENPGAMIFEVAPDAEDFTLRVKDLIRPQTSKKAEIYF